MKRFLFDHLPSIIVFLGIVCITLLIGYAARKTLNQFLANAKEDHSANLTNYSFVRYVFLAIIYGIGFCLAIYSVPELRAIGSAMLAGAGVFALAISFASQQALSNIIGGLFIVIFKPFKVSDRIQLTGRNLVGVVEDITLRHTVILDFENRRIIVPNSVISNEVLVNSDYKEDKICKHILFSVSYTSNIELAKGIIREEILQHPLQTDQRSEEEIANNTDELRVKVVNLGESSVDIKAWVWTKTSGDAFTLHFDVLESVKLRFDREGVEIPFPHRTLIQKN